MSRPKTDIDWKRVDSFLLAQCDGVAISGILGISSDTLYRACQEKFKIGFAAYSQKKKSEGKELLRRKQFDAAMGGDKTMLIWLGKQILQQKDQVETTLLVPQVNILPTTDADRKSIETDIQAIDEGNDGIHE